MHDLVKLFCLFRNCHKQVESNVSNEKNLLIQEFEKNVDWFLEQLKEERMRRNFLDDELAIKVSKRGSEKWYDLPKGIDLFFAVPYEEMHLLANEVRFIFQEFINLVDTEKLIPSRIIYLLQKIIEETNDKLKPLQLILSRP